MLPQARLVVDHWHVHRLANLMLTRVRQRVTRQVHGHRGRKSSAAWAYRQWARLGRLSASDDPTGQILGAWAGEELRRQLLIDLDVGARPYKVRARLDRFYQCTAQEDIPELATLALTAGTWGIPSRRSGLGCGLRDGASYRQRIVLHTAATAA